MKKALSILLALALLLTAAVSALEEGSPESFFTRPRIQRARAFLQSIQDH